MLNSDVSFLAIDFPGHGYSSQLPHGVFYNYIYYLLTVKYIKDSLKWSKVTLLGHSMGGLTSCLFTVFYRKEVDFLMCLDGFKPFVHTDILEQLAKNIMQFHKYHEFSLSSMEQKTYYLEEMVQKISIAHGNSINPEYANYILERNIAQSEQHPGKLNIWNSIGCFKSRT